MIYRIAQESDWVALEAAWKQCTTNPLPAKGLIEASIAEDNGQVVAFMCAQTVVDVGQLGIVPMYRRSAITHTAGSVSRAELLQPLDTLIRDTGVQGYVSFAVKNRDERFKSLGYTLPAMLVYRREF